MMWQGTQAMADKVIYSRREHIIRVSFNAFFIFLNFVVGGVFAIWAWRGFQDGDDRARRWAITAVVVPIMLGILPAYRIWWSVKRRPWK